MTKEWWIFLLRVIIFHRKSPPYKTPSERRYRAKREKTVTESRGDKCCLPGRDGRARIYAGHFVPGYARFTRYCLPGIIVQV